VDDRFQGLPTRQLRDGRVLIEAQTHRSRRRGLARLATLAPEHALHIPGTPSVHTFGMRFDLDLIWLDRTGAIVRIDRGVGPRRFRTCLRGRSVIETVAGQGHAFAADLVGADSRAPGSPTPS
jgi:uncharacterized membrane protein (UPF0127 family)